MMEVQSTPYVEELKEEDKRVQENTLRIRKEYETIFVSQSRDKTNGEHAYASYLYAHINENYFPAFEGHNKGIGSKILENTAY